MESTSAVLAQEGKLYSIDWAIKGPIPPASGQLKALGVAGPIVGKHNHNLIVAGGSNFPDSMPWLGGKKKYYNDVFVFRCTNKGRFELHEHSKLPFTIAYAASCSVNNGVLFAGGENENGISNKVWLLQWNEPKKNIDLTVFPDLPVQLTNASIGTHDHFVYLAGGEQINGVSKDLLILDLNNVSKGWEVLSYLPCPLSHSVMLMQRHGNDNCIYLVGGRRKRENSSSIFYENNWEFNLHSKKWSEKRSLPYALSAATGISVGDQHLLIIGGDKGETFHDTEELIIAIKNEANEARKKKLNEEKIRLQSSHPGFSKQSLIYDIVADKWTTLDSTPFPAPVTTTAVKWENAIVIPGGEIRAGVRTANIVVGEIKNHHK